MTFGLKVKQSGTTIKTGGLTTNPVSPTSFGSKLNTGTSIPLTSLHNNEAKSLPYTKIAGTDPKLENTEKANKTIFGNLMPPLLLPLPQKSAAEKNPLLGQFFEDIAGSQLAVVLDKVNNDLKENGPYSEKQKEIIAKASATSILTNESPTKTKFTRKTENSLPLGFGALGAIAVLNPGNIVAARTNISLPPLAPPRRILPAPTPNSADRLDAAATTIINGQFVPEYLAGISSLRPEIVALVNFNKIFDNSISLVDYGKFISLLYQLRILRQDVLRSIKLEFSSIESLNGLMQTVVDELKSSWNNVRQQLNFYIDNINQINKLKEAFDITKIKDEKYNTEKYLTLELFFQRRMQYTKQSYDSFTDTKLLSQLLFDFRSVLENYSTNLLNFLDTDRVDDFDPIKVDKTYTFTDGFSFTVDGIKAKFAFDDREFATFNNSLPAKEEDRIKLLLNVLSKELRVSKGLSNREVISIMREYYGADPIGVPFDNIIGTVGSDILEQPLGRNSLASLLMVKDGNTPILPFEQKTFDDTQTIFVPGTKYFIDSILTRKSDGGFNTQPVLDYVNQYSDKFFNAKNLINKLIEEDSTGSNLSPVAIFKSLLIALREATDSLLEAEVPNNTTRGTDSRSIEGENYKAQLLLIAIFKLAAKNREIKFLLFQYLIVAGVMLYPGRSEQKFFERISRELKQINNLPVFGQDITPPGINTGVSGLYPFFEEIINKLTAKIAESFSSQESIRRRRDWGDAADSGNDDTGTLGPTDDSNIGASLNVTIEDMKKLLKDSVIQGTNSTTTKGLIKSFLTLCYQLDSRATINGNDLSYTTTIGDDVPVTRFNQLTTSVLCLFLFESFVCFSNKFFDADLKYLFSSYRIQANRLQNSIIANEIKQLTTATAIPVETGTAISNGQTVKDSGWGDAVDSGNDDTGTPLNAAERNIAEAFNRGTSDGTSIGSKPSSSTFALQLKAKNKSISLTKNSTTKKITSTNTLPTVNGTATPSGGNSTATSTGGASLYGAGRELLNSSIGDLERIRSTVNNNSETLLAVPFNALKRAINDILTKLDEEDKIMRNFLHILEVIGDNLSTTTREVTSFFNNLVNNQTFLTTDTSNIYATQLRTANWIYDRYNDNVINARNLIANNINPQEFNAMMAMFKEPAFIKPLADNRMKLMVVGIPYGLTDKLLDTVNKRDVNRNTVLTKQSDIIRVCVHKKTAEDDDIVFYPNKYIFDLSIYPKQFEETAFNGTSFESFLRKYKLLDYTNFTKQEVTTDSLIFNDKYNFISTDDKKSLIKNHVVSQLLQLYFYIALGINMDETNFPISPYNGYSGISANSLSPTVLQLLQRWLVEVKGISETIANRQLIELLSSRQIPDDVKDNMKLLTYGPNILNRTLLSEKVLNKKKFDRVFVIPVDIDNFIIDIEKTRSTTSGVEATESNVFLETIGTISINNNEVYYIDRANEPNALIFEDFFITVESVI